MGEFEAKMVKYISSQPGNWVINSNPGIYTMGINGLHEYEIAILFGG
jgi:hypothetical protein